MAVGHHCRRNRGGRAQFSKALDRTIVLTIEDARRFAGTADGNAGFDTDGTDGVDWPTAARRSRRTSKANARKR